MLKYKAICQLLSKAFQIFTNFSTGMSLRKLPQIYKKLNKDLHYNTTVNRQNLQIKRCTKRFKDYTIRDHFYSLLKGSVVSGYEKKRTAYSVNRR